MSSLHARIAAGRRTLVAAGLTPDEAAVDADVLARYALGWERAALLANGRDPAPSGFEQAFASLISRRSTREPVAFITGHREFWGREFEVSRDVLIPRPETELIVEAARHAFAAAAPARLLDVGTGTGCLAISLALEFPAAQTTASDISAAALAVARRNARRHAPHVTLLMSDLLGAVDGTFDLIVSNPPYVPATAQLSPDVRHEPALALYAGASGLSMLARLIATAARALTDDGYLIVEFGHGQAAAVRSAAAGAGWRDVAIAEDLRGIPRVAVMRRPDA